MGKSITGILHIQGWWKVTHIEEENNRLHLYLFCMRKTTNCPRCKKRTKIGYDTQPVRTILHTTIGTQLVFLHIAPRRFICSCTPDKPFREKLSGVSGARSTTERFDQELMQHLSGHAFKTITGKLGLTYPSQRLRLTEVKQGIPLGILPNNKKITIQEALASCPKDLADRIKSVTVDMDDGAIAAIRNIFPKSLIVIDHFHVIQDANNRLDEARRIEQEAINFERGKRARAKLDIPCKLMRMAKEHLKPYEQVTLSVLLVRYPRLKMWYDCKEQVRGIYTAQNREEAEKQLHVIINTMLCSDDISLTFWGKSLKYYKEEILNYFAYRTTNAYTEGLNVRCKLVQRISSGFRNVDVYIRKAMLVLLPLSVAITGTVYINNYPLPLS